MNVHHTVRCARLWLALRADPDPAAAERFAGAVAEETHSLARLQGFLLRHVRAGDAETIESARRELGETSS